MHTYHEEIAKHGCVIIPNFLSEEEILLYRTAANKIIDVAREGKWSHVRTRGKQFPPWPSNFSPDIWGVTGLLDPGLGELSYPFHEFYSSDRILSVAADILQTPKESLTMELLNMLINPLTDFELDWHRDDIKPDATPEEESKLLSVPYAGTQYNIALYEDNCLIVVPGSHNRIRTPEEREKTTSPNRTQHITDEIIVKLNPGDAVFYNSNILHRARYIAKETRATLHGCYGHPDHGEIRARLVLQHGVGEWLPRFQPRTKNLAIICEHLRDFANQFKNVDLGYSQDNI